jgi:hypothetical protein
MPSSLKVAIASVLATAKRDLYSLKKRKRLILKSEKAYFEKAY